MHTLSISPSSYVRALNQRLFLIGQWKSVGKTKIQIELACNSSEGDFVLIIKSSSPIDYICVYLDWKGKIEHKTLFYTHHQSILHLIKTFIYENNSTKSLKVSLFTSLFVAIKSVTISWNMRIGNHIQKWIIIIIVSMNNSHKIEKIA